MLLFIRELFSTPFRLLSALGEVISDRKLLGLCVIPYIIGVLAFVTSLIFAFSYRSDLTAIIVSDSQSWLATLTGFGISILAILVSGIVALIAVLVLGSFFIESLIEELLKRHGLLADNSISISSLILSTLRGLKDDVIRLLYLGFIALVAFVCSFFPILLFIPIALGVFFVGYDLYDLPLLLMGKRFRERWTLLSAHRGELMALGANYSLVMLVPFLGIFLLPLAYAVVVKKVAEWHKAGLLTS